MENQASGGEIDQAQAGVSTLTELETRILEFERQWWRYAGAKESAIK